MSSPADFARRVLQVVKGAGWPAAGAGAKTRWLLAVSGGLDSTALAAVLAELRDANELPIELRIAHFDHAIRPTSAAETGRVRDLAARLRCEFVVERGDVPALRAREKLSLEEAARLARLDFLERAAAECAAACVATGHTADDQAETVLFRILRGTGLKGLAGMSASRPISGHHPEILLVRPLLGFRRADVLAYLAAKQLDYLTDESNFDVEHQARARIRHELLPLLGRGNPGVRAALLHLAEQARSAQEALTAVAGSRLPVAGKNGEITLPLDLLNCPEALRSEIFILAAEHVAGRSLRARRRLAEAARYLASRAAQVGARFEIGGLVIERGYDCAILRKLSAPSSPELPSGWSCPVAVPGVTELPVGRMTAKIVNRSDFAPEAFFRSKSPLAEVFDARLLLSTAHQPFFRSRRPGDRFHPFGAPGEKKLKSFLIDRKLPRAERAAAPLLVLGDEILWVVGARLSEHARVGADTERLVLMQFESDCPRTPPLNHARGGL